MNQKAIAGWAPPLETLRQLAQARTVAEEVCDFCSARLAPIHRHLLEIVPRKIVCVCDACALTFQGVAGGRYKLVPRVAKRLAQFRVTDAQWDSLALPINLVFIFHSTPQQKVVALYPSPAGVTESLLPRAHWNALEADNPVLAQLEPDVEALLINRTGNTREYYLVPIATRAGKRRWSARSSFREFRFWVRANAARPSCLFRSRRAGLWKPFGIGRNGLWGL